jgi:hypothetical protein
MLYKNKERVTDFKKYVEELKVVFPSFFSSSNPKGIQIRYVESSKQRVKKRVGNNSKANTLTALSSPLPTSFKAISYVVNENGLREEIVFSKVAPEFNPQKQALIFKKAELILSDETYLRPVQDLEQLIYLYFYSGFLVNGKNANPAARLEFVVPEITAAKRVNDPIKRQINVLESEILFGEVGIDVITNVLKVLGIPTDEEESVLRTRLFDHIVPNSTAFNDAALAQYQSLKGNSSGAASKAEVSEYVHLALVEGAVVDTENGWCFVGKNGTTGQPFAEIVGVTKDEKVDNLVEAFVADPKLKTRLDKALMK